MWIMDSETIGESAKKRVYYKFDFSKKMFYISLGVWYNYMRTIVLFYGVNRRTEASQCHYHITNFGNC